MADDLLSLKMAVLHGVGVGMIPDYMCTEALRSGQLQRLLPGWSQDIVDRVRRRCRMDTVWCLLGLEVIWMRPVGGGAKVSYDQRRQWEKRYKRMKQGGAA